MTDEVKRKIPFETRLNCFKERVVDFFKNEYRNPNGNEDCIEVCIIRDGYRTVLSLEEEINRQKAEIERKTKHIAEIVDEYAKFKEAAKRRETARVRNIEQVADEEINRLQAEVERLKKDKYIIKDGVLELVPRTDIEEIKSEARKEFAEKLKKISRIYLNRKEMLTHAVSLEEIDNLLKEMKVE